MARYQGQTQATINQSSCMTGPKWWAKITTEYSKQGKLHGLMGTGISHRKEYGEPNTLWQASRRAISPMDAPRSSNNKDKRNQRTAARMVCTKQHNLDYHAKSIDAGGQTCNDLLIESSGRRLKFAKAAQLRARPSSKAQGN